MRYLILEDAPVIRRILKEVFNLLEIDGKFTFLENGEEAQIWLEQSAVQDSKDAPDVVFIDIRTPPHQGYAIAEQIRAVPPLADARIVLMFPPDISREEMERVVQRSRVDRWLARSLLGVKDLNQIVEAILTPPPAGTQAI